MKQTLFGTRISLLALLICGLIFTTCVESVGLGSTCICPDDCTTTHPNSECKKGVGDLEKKCYCKYPYQQVKDLCAAPFDKSCVKDKACIDPTNECSKDTLTCQCKTGFVAVDKKCKARLGYECKTTTDCSNYLGNCTQEGKCGCKDGFQTILDEDRCAADFNSFCIISGGGCVTENAICSVVESTMSCQCAPGFSYVPAKGACSKANGIILPSSAITLILMCIINKKFI